LEFEAVEKHFSFCSATRRFDFKTVTDENSFESSLHGQIIVDDEHPNIV